MRSGIGALLAAALAAGCARTPEVRWVPEAGEPAGGGRPGGGRFEAGPVPEGKALPEGEVDPRRGAELFELRLAGAGTEGLPAVAGVYRAAGRTLVFEPSFPLQPGTRYAAVFLPGGPEAVRAEVAIPEPDRTPTSTVEAIYPSADLLPENLLRLYIVFSAPMTRGQAWENLRILDDSGGQVEMPFLELDEELWDRSGRRLTVLIDPGRVKRGVRPLEEIGPALVDGRSFVLEVLPAWEDAEGKPLRSGFRKAFRVGPPDRQPIDPSSWKVSAPAAGGLAPLSVALGEALDHGLLRSAMGVAGPGGRTVEGTIGVRDAERTWSFTPGTPWAEGEHAIVIATILEDVAGNGVGRPFEVDALEPFSRRIEVREVRIPFRPVAAGSGAEPSAAGSAAAPAPVSGSR